MRSGSQFLPDHRRRGAGASPSISTSKEEQGAGDAPSSPATLTSARVEKARGGRLLRAATMFRESLLVKRGDGQSARFFIDTVRGFLGSCRPTRQQEAAPAVPQQCDRDPKTRTQGPCPPEVHGSDIR